MEEETERSAEAGVEWADASKTPMPSAEIDLAERTAWQDQGSLAIKVEISVRLFIIGSKGERGAKMRGASPALRGRRQEILEKNLGFCMNAERWHLGSA